MLDELRDILRFTCHEVSLFNRAQLTAEERKDIVGATMSFIVLVTFYNVAQVDISTIHCAASNAPPSPLLFARG